MEEDGRGGGREQDGVNNRLKTELPTENSMPDPLWTTCKTCSLILKAAI